MRIFAMSAAAVVCGLLAERAEAGMQAFADIASSAGSYYPYHYDITLHNTGTQGISTFWFAWDDSGLNFLPNYPYTFAAPAGWYPMLTDNYYVSSTPGYGVEWYNYFGSPIAPGTSAHFSFESYDSPAVVNGLSDVPPINPGDSPFPVLTSFVYAQYPAQQPGDPGFQFIVGAPGAVPEPATMGLLGAGVAALLCKRRRQNSY